jgi:hypothetical protein
MPRCRVCGRRGCGCCCCGHWRARGEYATSARSAGLDLILHDGLGTAVLRCGCSRAAGAGSGRRIHEKAPVEIAGVGRACPLLGTIRRVTPGSSTRDGIAARRLALQARNVGIPEAMSRPGRRCPSSLAGLQFHSPQRAVDDVDRHLLRVQALARACDRISVQAMSMGTWARSASTPLACSMRTRLFIAVCSCSASTYFAVRSVPATAPMVATSAIACPTATSCSLSSTPATPNRLTAPITSSRNRIGSACADPNPNCWSLPRSAATGPATSRRRG